MKFGVVQMLGIGLLMLIPVLALFNVFGDGDATVRARSSTLSMTVEYSPRLRHATADVVVAEIRNSSGAFMDTVTVIFDSSYVSKVSEPRFTPPASRAFELDLLAMRPGESRRIELAFSSENYGWHSGDILALHKGDTARVSVRTLVFP